MPSYTFKNKETGEQFNLFLSIAERETYLAENPQVEQLIVAAPAYCDPWRVGLKKPDQGWRDLLKSIKKRNHGADINTF